LFFFQSQAGTYQIRDAANYPDVYKITKGFPDGEYLLIENRQPVGWDFQVRKCLVRYWPIFFTGLCSQHIHYHFAFQHYFN
jgi:hypothetical protein